MNGLIFYQKPTTPSAMQHSSQYSFLHNLRLRRLPSTLLVFVPISKDIADPRTIGQFVNFLKIRFRYLERFGGNIGDVFTDELARVNARLVDLLQQKASERLDAGTQECAMERYVNSLERNRCETTLEFKRLWFALGLFGALFDDLDEALFDLFQ